MGMTLSVLPFNWRLLQSAANEFLFGFPTAWVSLAA